MALRSSSLRVLPLGRVTDVSPVFIVGMPRSGTSLLRLIINAHPEIAIVGESYVFGRRRRYGPLHDPTHLLRLVEDLTPTFSLQSPHPDLLEAPDLLAALSRAPSYAEALRLVMSAYADREGKPRWGEKTPSHIRRVGTILTAFPNAQVIHIVRDPRAVIVSTRQTFADGTFTDASVYHLARAWRRSVTLLDRFDDGGARYRVVRYEDLVFRTEPTLRELCEFLGVDYDPGMLDYHVDAIRYAARAEDGSVMPSHVTTLDSLREDRVERWQAVLTPEHAALVEAVAGKVMRRFGYGPTEGAGRRPGLLRRLRAAAGADVAVARGRLRAAVGGANSTMRRWGSGLRSRPASRRGDKA